MLAQFISQTKIPLTSHFLQEKNHAYQDCRNSTQQSTDHHITYETYKICKQFLLANK